MSKKSSRPLALRERILLARIAERFVSLWRSDLSHQERAATDILVQAGYLRVRADETAILGILELTNLARYLLSREDTRARSQEKEGGPMTKVKQAVADSVIVIMTRDEAMSLLKVGNLGIDTMSNVDPREYPGLTQEQNELMDQANDVLVTIVKVLGA